MFCKSYQKVREANLCSLSYRRSPSLLNLSKLDKTCSWKTTQSRWGSLRKSSNSGNGQYIVTKVITKVNNVVTFDSDPTTTQVVHRNQVVEHFSCDNELSNLPSNYEKPFNDDKTENFFNKKSKNRLFQFNQQNA